MKKTQDEQTDKEFLDVKKDLWLSGKKIENEFDQYVQSLKDKSVFVANLGEKTESNLKDRKNNSKESKQADSKNEEQYLNKSMTSK